MLRGDSMEARLQAVERRQDVRAGLGRAAKRRRKRVQCPHV